MYVHTFITSMTQDTLTNTSDTVESKHTESLVHPLILNRRSGFAFSNKPLNKEVINSLFEAIRWAPSAYNEQPWRFIYAEKSQTEAYEKLLSLLFDGNSRWAHAAPFLMLNITRETLSANGKPNIHSWHDMGLAISNLSLQATHLGLTMHQFGGFDREKAHEIFQIPMEYTAVSMIAIGYKGDDELLAPDLKARATGVRKRREIQDFAFEGAWSAE